MPFEHERARAGTAPARPRRLAAPRPGWLALGLSIIGVAACGGTAASSGHDPAAPDTPADAQRADAAPPDAAPPPEAWVERRLADADARLAASEGGRLVARSMDAHGGLRGWLAMGTLAFDFDYAPLDAPDRRMATRQRVDVWRARAVHRELGADGDATFGWDGEVAWITPGPDAFPITPRFWALTPYYFVGMPFVLGDPGVRLERLPDEDLDGRRWTMVKATFDPGTGDAPDDYYVLYLEPSTHRLHALRYVVSYPGFAGGRYPPGGHTPEVLMRLSGHVAVAGLSLPTRLDTWRWDAAAGVPGDPRVEVRAGDYAAGERVPGEAFAPPSGAVVLEAL